MKTNKYQDIKRSELLDRIDQGWVLRRKVWASSGDVKGKEAFGEGSSLLCDDWEGHPPAPKLKILVRDVYLEDALTYMRQSEKSGNAYMINTQVNSRFIGWYGSKLWYFDEDFKPTAEVSFNGSLDVFYRNWSVYVRE